MKILWSIHLYPPIHNCGAEWMAHNINRYLITKGHNIKVLVHQSRFKKAYCLDGVDVFPVGTENELLNWADIVFTHLDYTKWTINECFTRRKKLYHFIHNSMPYYSIINADPETNFIVYNSEWVKKEIGYKHESIVLHPTCSKKDYEVDNSKAEYITLINLNKNKGAEQFYKIAKELPHKKFLAVKGSYDKQILSHLPNVTTIENTKDIKKVYEKTKILLMPSEYESFGRTATEAALNGIPVICTPTPGLKENLGKAGIYLDRDDTEAWVKAIEKLDNEKEYLKQSKKVKERFEQMDFDNQLQRLEQFIHS